MRVITLGTFDLLHRGHFELFKKCRELGEYITVGLNTDEFVYEYKKKYPIMNYEERERAIMSLPWIDQVLPNSQPDKTIKDILIDTRANLIVVGSDWRKRDYLKQVGLNDEWLDDNDISLCYVPYTWEISSSEIKKRICELV